MVAFCFNIFTSIFQECRNHFVYSGGMRFSGMVRPFSRKSGSRGMQGARKAGHAVSASFVMRRSLVDFADILIALVIS
jgi:hypothetical protein